MTATTNASLTARFSPRFATALAASGAELRTCSAALAVMEVLMKPSIALPLLQFEPERFRLPDQYRGEEIKME